MLWGYNIFITGMLLACSINVILIVMATRRHPNLLTTSFAGLMAASSVYAFGYLLEISSSTLDLAFFWIKVEYLGIVWIPFFWIVLVLEYTGKRKWLTRPLLAALCVIPIVTLIMVYTNDNHHLYYRALYLNSYGQFSILDLVKGPWYWVFQVYLNLLLLSGNVFLFLVSLRTTLPQRKQIAVILTGSLLFWLTYVIYIFGKSPLGLDLTPLAFSLAGPPYAWGVFRYRLFNLVPVAYENIFAGMSEGVLVLDINNRIIDYNPAACIFIDNLSRKAIGEQAEKVFSGNTRLLEQLSLDSAEQIEVKSENPEGEKYYQYRISPVISKNKKIIGKTVIVSDTTQQVLLLKKLRLLATTDVLTETYNRGHFMEISAKELDYARQQKQPVSAILLDIDNFKLINDTYGHEAGDIALGSITKASSDCLRDTDIFCRYGGDEFAVFLPNSSLDKALLVAERLRKNIAGTSVQLSALNTVLTVTASFGVASTQWSEDINLDELLNNADKALYEAKNSGRNAVRAANDNTASLFG